MTKSSVRTILASSLIKTMATPSCPRRPQRLLFVVTMTSYLIATNSLSWSKGVRSDIPANRHGSRISSRHHSHRLALQRRQWYNRNNFHFPTSRYKYLKTMQHTLNNASTTSNNDSPHDAQQSIAIKPLNERLTKLFNYDLSVPAVLLASFLNLLGFTMASPIQPALGKHFALPIGASFGSLSSAYPLGMLLGVFLWPTLSDILGRKFVMALTLFGSGMGLFIQSVGIRQGWTLEQFLAARILTGCFAGNSPISKAYLADRGSSSSISGELTKYLAWKDAASTLAFILGPVLGGLVYQQLCRSSVVWNAACDESRRISFVIFCSAVASLLASVSTVLFVNETKRNQRRNVESSKFEQSVKVMEVETSKAELISCPLGSMLWAGVASVAVVSSLYHAADSTFFAFFPTLLQNRLNVGTQAVGMALTSLAIVSFAISAFVTSRTMKAFGPVAACSAGLGAVGTGLWTLGYAASLPVGLNGGLTTSLILGASALYYIGVPLFGPSVPTMLLLCVPAHRRGAVMGFDGAINTLARVVSPLVIGEIHRVKGAGACFRVAGSCAYMAMVVALLRRYWVLRGMFGKSSSAKDSDIANTMRHGDEN